MQPTDCRKQALVGTGTSQGVWVCQSSRSRFTHHFEAADL